MKHGEVHWDIPDIPENSDFFKPHYDVSEEEQSRDNADKDIKTTDTTSQ